MTRLVELAKTIRSKNAGVDAVTFDVIFDDPVSYRRVCDSGVLSPDVVARLFRVDLATITDFVTFDPANAIKFTLRRSTPSGSAGDPDMFGAQQYPPLFDIDVP